MYIQPDTEIKILQNIPLNKTYEHTVRYANKDEQFNAFNKYTKYTLENYSYQRMNVGSIRIEKKYEELYNCNYLMFKNSAFENKWFYSFITGCSYVSNEVSEIYYELDEMQTWAYDYEFLETFVERQHATDDTIYSNTQPEGLELGSDYIYEKTHTINLGSTNDSEKVFTILATTSSNGQKPKTRVLNGALFSLWYNQVTGIENARNLIQEYIDNGYESNIISIYTTVSGSVSKNIKFTRKNDIDGYIPKNNKLYCYPFSYLMLYNNLGESIDLKYENFVDQNGNKIAELNNQFSFQSISIDSPVPTAKCFPWNYLQTGSDVTAVNSVTYSQFPTGAFSGDSFKVWLAQNKNSYGASLNAIQNSYDTNIQTSMLAYSQAVRNAENSASITKNSIRSAVKEAGASYNLAYGADDSIYNQKRTQNIANSAISAIGQVLSGNSAGGATNMGLTALNTYFNDNIAGDLYTAQLNSAMRVGAVNFKNADLALANARENAETSQASTALSALTVAQNATSQLVAKKQDAMHVPTNLHGAMMNDSWNGANNIIGFTIWERSIKKEYAEIIDRYFDKYGYSQRKMYKPVILNRPHWSFLKTTGANIKGNLNQTDLYIIKTIYDNGITTWDTLENVGNYSLTNK